MSHALVDRYEDPERVISALNRRRQLKVYAVLGGLVVALGVLFAAAAAMYSDEPDAAQPVSVVE